MLISKGSGLLRNKLLNLNGGGNALILFPLLNLGGLTLDARSVNLLVLNDRII